ncbi:MAG: hypothetical protein K9K66_12290 [Desulfarculaceae bacterium]|nr:hypothetical protein [Desulfarculaceae bacterium]MCF8071726.1 hypothetical protein [Desulfarculaceae bacterium]MCF8102427.1 hypothetical protein [Desulfarculaceae bacterium]MCF8116769.1 hypothetical protein [Desulfarculaceae bacterium]
MPDETDSENQMEEKIKTWDVEIKKFQDKAGDDPKQKKIILDLMKAKDEFRNELGAIKRESPLEDTWDKRIPQVEATGRKVEEIFALAEKVFAH